jgi:cytochrome P450
MVQTAAYAIEDLCEHSDIVPALREEMSLSDAKPIDPTKFPLLDSFLRESMRHSTSDSISGRRKVLKPFVFSDGTEAKLGDWVCVPQAAMNRDAQYYSNPEVFDAFRFINSSRLTDAKFPWMIWGLSRAAW